MRKAHIITAPTSNQGHPTQYITFDVETRPATCDLNGPCAACQRIRDGAMTADDEIASLVYGHAIAWNGDELSFVDASAFWDWVTAFDGHVWLVNHNIAFDLMVLDWDAAMTSRGWHAKKIIIPEPSGPFAVEWCNGHRKITMANLANWWGMRPLSSIGKIVGTYKGGVDPTLPKYRHAIEGSDAFKELARYCRQDCLVVRDALLMWSRFLLDHDLGPFALTQAGQALTAFRHRFMNHDIYIHTNKNTLALERASYVGGRTEAFRLGDIEGPCHVVDVNSLYPYVMSSHSYPACWMGTVTASRVNGGLSTDDISAVIEGGSQVIARVTCHVGNDENQRVAPVVHDGRLLYPTGTFTTTLCTPELDRAIRRGIVVTVDEMATYESQPLFKEYVEELYALRMQYRDAGNAVWYEIVKVFLNSLYGKFGQYNHEWKDTGDELSLPPGTHVIVGDDGIRNTYRSLGGTIRIKSSERVEGYHSFAAIAAHVTSYARDYLSTLREIAGYDHVYYCDTDSLFVDDQGLRNLSAYIDADILGALKMETSASRLIIRGLKDYTIGDKTKLKGVRKNAERTVDGAYRQTQFRGIAGALRAGEPGVARVGQIVKRPTGKYLKGTRGADGWVTPIVLP